MMDEEAFAALEDEARACRACADLPLGPRPTFRVSLTARLLIVGQAPGTRVHETGIPWNDRSGIRLRGWLGLDPETFYDSARIAIVPTGLCYPGRARNGGDAPPRKQCAPLWHPRLIPAMPRIALTLAVGAYAQEAVLGPRRRASMSETVGAFRDYLPQILPLPHPSWRTTGWERKNPWFGEDLLPALRHRVATLLSA